VHNILHLSYNQIYPFTTFTPELALVRRKLAEDVRRRVSVIASYADPKSVKAHLAPQRGYDAFDSIVTIG
jgi:hypothetical protein